jgi:thiamine-monophosphate kinase
LSSPGSDTLRRVSDIGERALIERIRALLPQAPPELVVGIGDDAAVARPDRGSLQVLTTDALVEGVHFDLRFSTPADVGYKALAVNVSDIAAMGGAPRLAMLSLMLPADTVLQTVDGLIEGLTEIAAATGVTLAGGNITRCPGPLIVDVSLIGSVKPRKILRRSGGRAGDGVYVTGQIGMGAAGLGWLRSNESRRLPDDGTLAECVQRHRRPEPRARIGALLGRNRAASACMDLSDGIADAIAQVAAASGTGATIDASALPVHPAARAWFSSEGDRPPGQNSASDPMTAILSGGDDYELLFTVPKRRRGRLRAVMREARGVPITRIGELTEGSEVVLEQDGRREPMPPGFVHF